MGRVTARRRMLRLSLSACGDGRSRREDLLVVEEPLEIRLGGRPLTVTMRTPGADFDLVAGFLVTEGVIRSASDLAAMRQCDDAGPTAGADSPGAGLGDVGSYDPYTDDNFGTYNIVDATLTPGVPPPAATLQRHFFTTSSCGLCGKAGIDAIRAVSPYDVAADPVRFDPAVLVRLPERMRAAQRVFERTGGLHAAALFTPDGELLCLREDVGRHNAVDKVIGWALRADRLPLRGLALQVSGRASFELAQKAVMAGVPLLSAVSAPSSLAVDLAAEAGLTLVGFARGSALNVYARTDRLDLA